MTEKKIKIGQEIQSFTNTVASCKIREMATAIGDPNPIYFDSNKAKASGYKDLVAPPTFGLPLKRWGSEGLEHSVYASMLDVDPFLMMHGEQEFIYYGEINPGDEITGIERVTDIQEKSKLFVIVTDTDFYNQDGNHVLTSRFTIIEKKEVS
jgi:acyl dehydratase